MQKAMRPKSDTQWLVHGQKSELVVMDITAPNSAAPIYDSYSLLEAPNWSLDGSWLIINGDGRLWRISPDGAQGPHRINTFPVENLNNDHVLDPDGEHVFISANDGHLYRVAVSGGTPKRITHQTDQRHYLHGVSPDGKELAYVALHRDGDRIVTRIATIPTQGGESRYLTDGACPVDGPEYSPCGQWIYFNSEAAATQPGHAQIFRMRTDGSNVEQLTFDERVNWFPHLSPDGKHMVYISYPEGTLGHPPNKEVELRLMDPSGGTFKTLDQFHGGQGTINVTSWHPDSKQIAYMRFPLEENA